MSYHIRSSTHVALVYIELKNPNYEYTLSIERNFDTTHLYDFFASNPFTIEQLNSVKVLNCCKKSMHLIDTLRKQTVLVTGGGGYIGSHTVKALQGVGYRVVVLDNLVYGHQDVVKNVLKAEMIEGEIGDRALLDQIFSTYEIAAVIHFAAYAYVGESTSNPAKYYANNVCGTLSLLQAMVSAGVNKLVFSSTCAIYGVPDSLPIAEADPKNPVNPYGRTKLIVEQMLDDFDSAYGLSSICFRYFNAAGADPAGELGEDHTPETHLIPLVLEAAANRRSAISIFGTDYPTADGTCVRDYIHVSDLARAHVLGLEHSLQGNPSQKINLSNGSGFSVRQVIETARAVTGRSIEVTEEARRAGDPPILIGSSEKALTLLGWEPHHPDLVDIITHAWQWHQKRHGVDQHFQEYLCSNV